MIPFDTHLAHVYSLSASALLGISKHPGAPTLGDREA